MRNVQSCSSHTQSSSSMGKCIRSHKNVMIYYLMVFTSNKQQEKEKKELRVEELLIGKSCVTLSQKVLT